MTLDPAVAAVRLAVRRALADVERRRVLVACSGGADSLALLAATVFEARRSRLAGRRGHRRPRPAGRARPSRRAGWSRRWRRLGVDETVAVRVDVDRRRPGPRGGRPRGEVRRAGRGRRSGSGPPSSCSGTPSTTRPRRCCSGWPAGSGGRSLSGMRARLRPATAGRCSTSPAPRPRRPAGPRASSSGRDPHNEDPRFTRSRVRHRVLPVLEARARARGRRRAGPHRRPAPRGRRRPRRARRTRARRGWTGTARWACSPRSGAQPRAVLVRVLRLRRARARAAPPPSCSACTCWRSVELVAGRPVRSAASRSQLPGHVTAYRDGDLLRFRRTAVAG